MKVEVAIGIGAALGTGGALVATPVAIRAARRLGFLDHPREYRRHSAPTPFLGGSAVLAAFLLAAIVVGTSARGFGVVLGCAVGLWAIGTLDDRAAVPPAWRVVAEAAAAGAVFAVGLGWNTAATGPVDLLLTIAWIVGVVNAFNLMDNLDGACGTVAAVSATGIGILAAIKGQVPVAGLSFGLAGACAAFLRSNLARPAKIFLGDGGSMPVGFLIAALAMATARHSPSGSAGILVGALLAGLPILDVTLVSVSRGRRGVSVLTGGRDHLTHRLLTVLRSPSLVAVALAVSQATLCGLAIAGYELGSGGLAALAFGAFVAGAGAIVLLDTQRWRPAGIATSETITAVAAEHPVPVSAESQ